MKTLLLHHEDEPAKGPWATQEWDRIVDAGLGGKSTYDDWSRHFRCPVTTLGSFWRGFDDFRQVRELLGLGCGRLIDEFALDWWEIMSILLHGEIETLIRVQRFAGTIGPGDEVCVSRPGLHADLLRPLLGQRLKVFAMQHRSRKGLQHYLRISTKLSLPQMIDVFWDKYDSGYQLRGQLQRKRRPRKRGSSMRPVVLVPTAYVNVSRTGVAYANTFPGEDFLLVTTRRSGWLNNLPKNMEAARLSSYASVLDRSHENANLEVRFRALLKELCAAPELEILNRLGYFDSFPRRFRHGIEVRDAWRNVLDSEPVQAVLCADDSNPYTRIPLLLARSRGLPNIACHHGALDGRYVFKRTYGDIIWAKGNMELDYLVRKCGVPSEQVEICAPVLPAKAKAASNWNRNDFRPYLVFFSEVYEVSGGRLAGIYRDVLPPLADLALATGRRLLVKLHPAESQQERTRMLARVLSADQMSAVDVVSSPLTDNLLAKTWCGVTILSTVAMECAVRGIPCFLCKWLEGWPFEYVEQFIRYGVGIGLGNSGDIANIPQLLPLSPMRAGVNDNFWQSAPGRLRELLTTPRKECTAAAS